MLKWVELQGDMKLPLLEVKNLTTEFRSNRKQIVAVDDISFSIDYGETVGLVGESGCGKSVTSLSIMRLVEHTGGKIKTGSIIFDGIDLTSLKPRAICNINGRRIAMVFQDPMSSLNPTLTIGVQLVETIRRHLGLKKTEAARAAIKMLEAVGINDAQSRMKSYPFQLSGGQRQRVMIAIALSCRPDLLIADEPTTALDVTIQAQILDLLQELKESFGMSVLLITHDLGVVADMAQKIFVMYAGQIVEKGDVFEIFENPRHPYTIGLLGAVPSIDGDGGRLNVIPGSLPAPDEYPEGCRFSDRCEYCRPLCINRQPPEFSDGSHSWRCWRGSEVYVAGENRGGRYV